MIPKSSAHRHLPQVFVKSQSALMLIRLANTVQNALLLNNFIWEKKSTLITFLKGIQVLMIRIQWIHSVFVKCWYLFKL